MRGSRRLSSVLRNGGLSLHGLVGRLLGVGFVAQCWLLTVIAGGLVLIASTLDGSLRLNGRDVGLLQHPAIWAFFALQLVLPIVIKRSLVRLLRSRDSLRAVGALNGHPQEQIVMPFLRFLHLKDPGSRLAAAIVYGFGLTAFVWNTYQNQRPGIALPFDFWDSKTFFYGFWITRLYKLYLFAWLLPYLAMLHIDMLVIGLRLIRVARLNGKFKLLPFHPDRSGGIGFLPDLVTRPLVVAVLLALLPTIAAFSIHRAADVTPLMGLSVLASGLAVAYFIPILNLRTDIVAAKQDLVERLRWLQQASFSQVIANQRPNFQSLKTANETIENYEKLCTAVSNVSNYPHLKRLVGVMVLAMTPTATSLAAKLYEKFGPVIQHWSERS
jgi:hypothetical protein